MRLATFVQKKGVCPESLVDDVRSFANGAGLRDDATVIMLTRCQPGDMESQAND